MSVAKQTDFDLYRRLLGIARPYWAHIAVIFALSLLAPLLALLAPLPLKIAVDSVIDSEPLPAFLRPFVPAWIIQSQQSMLIFSALLLVIIALANRIHGVLTSLLNTYTGEKLAVSFRSRLFCHLQRLSLTYHDEAGTADSMYRLQYDAAAIRYIAIDGFLPFISSTLTLIAMIYVISRINWQLGLVALTISPFLFAFARFYRRKLRGDWRRVKEHDSSALSVLQESLSAVRVVKAFTREDEEDRRYNEHADNTIQAQLKAGLTEGSFGLLIGMTTTLGTAAVLYFGVRQVQTGSLTLGEMLLVMAYIRQLYDPLKTIGRKIASLQSHFASAERAFAVLDEALEVPERADARTIERCHGAVAFQDMSFAYVPGQLILNHVTIEIPPGARVGIAGQTGAGKTTLVSLLMRFYDPTEGRILLDGVDLRDYRVRDLRNQFSIVLQDTVLFSTSIAENIAYARPSASREDIVAAAKNANAHGFIESFPDGYETRVGERGMRLSGGERQRISLARAFLKDAPVLILDEPTSAVDVKTEASIIETMETLMQGRTVFMIAHRLSTLSNCDVRLELGTDGKLLELRRHHERSKASL